MSSVSRTAESTASRAANSRWLELLARAGFIGYGIVHLLFAWLALQIAWGGSSEEGDQSGAMQKIAEQPMGKFLVIAIGIGLAAMAIWQLLEALVGHTAERGKGRVVERVASAGRAIVYAYFAFTAFKVFNGASASTADSQQKTTEGLLGSTGGRWLVALAGLAVAALGVGLVIYGVVKRFEKHINTGLMSPADPQAQPPPGRRRLLRQGRGVHHRRHPVRGRRGQLRPGEGPRPRRGAQHAARPTVRADPPHAGRARHRRVRRLLLRPVQVPEGVTSSGPDDHD